MRLAYFSPLTPQRSGISDYSEELLPHLARGAELTLFVDGFQPMNRELTSRFEVLDYRRQRSHLKKLDGFDAVIYHMGNDHRYHAGILDAMSCRPGIVVLHDFALQDFYLGLSRERRDVRIYLDEVERCHGKVARAEAAESLTRGATPAIVERPVQFPLNCGIANSAEGIIVHSEWSQQRLATIAPGIPLAHIPMPIRFAPETNRIPSADAEIRIASFGLITPGKGIEHALRALSRLQHSHSFRYSLVGETNSFFDVRELIARYQMTDRVEITGHLSLDEFKHRISETDIALNLRERTVGETSASLCRLMAAGVCSLVADVGWYAELPNDAVIKVQLDQYTDKLLAAYLARLIEDDALRKQIGENAKRFARTEHNLDRGAKSYLGFIAEVIGGRTRREFINGVKNELALLGVHAADETVMRSVAGEIATLLPPANGSGRASADVSPASGNGAKPAPQLSGRTPKVEGIDYKRAAREYLSKLSEERQHHLRTKPFYNLANKPAKYKTAGMDEDTHRHFCDFANIARLLALSPGSRILDVGCGSGWLSEYFARLGYEVKGIDISPDLVEMSRERVARVPYGADHETPLKCTFAVHDVEGGSLAEKFDAIICYDSLHHFEDEHAVITNIAAMLDVGGVLFILEGERPSAGSASEEELRSVMNQFRTLESPFNYGYLRQLLEENGFAVLGDYVSVNGLFDRESINEDQLPLRTLDTDYHYLSCKKVIAGAHASTVPDSREPGVLRAQIALQSKKPISLVEPATRFEVALQITNLGDTVWLAGAEPRTGIVMPAVRVIDESGLIISELHGEPALPNAVAPGETIRLKIEQAAPSRPGSYVMKIDLVAEHVCWFEQKGSEPLLIPFEVAE
jgi:2-polyprenyl-3-methyl-5-hydroxy-6-metoxy-1,4-benzoquinol methylase/glycosyltransferase involved in cell wall biosynthesis